MHRGGKLAREIQALRKHHTLYEAQHKNISLQYFLFYSCYVIYIILLQLIELNSALNEVWWLECIYRSVFSFVICLKQEGKYKHCKGNSAKIFLSNESYNTEKIGYNIRQNCLRQKTELLIIEDKRQNLFMQNNTTKQI